ncbi:MAG: hypothetical protein ACYC8V_03185 [Caulobacteraceae bacterium]
MATPSTPVGGSLSWTVLAAALAALAATLFLPQILNDGDTWWHLAAGDWIIAHRAPPHLDPFSYTRAGAPWLAHEWFSEVLLSIAYRLADWRGVMALSALAAGTAVWVVARRVARDLDGTALVIVLAIGISLLAPSLLARPHLLALPILAAWTVFLVSARDQDRAPSLLALPLMTLWANLHGGFAFGLALIAPFALEALLHASPKDRLRVVRGWGIFALGAVGAALLTPFGFQGLVFPLKLVSMSSLAHIGEWQATDFSKPGPLEVALLALLGAALARPIRAPVVRLALLLGLVHLALHQARHQMLLGIVGPILLSGPLARAFPRQATAGSRRRGAFEALAASLAVVLLVGLRLWIPVVRVDSPASPIAALNATPDWIRRGRVLNDYAFGGYLIWKGVPVFVDSRAELYGDGFLGRYAEIIRPDPRALEQALVKYDIGWTILSPSQPLVGLLDADPRWRRLYADPFAVVHVRTSPAPGAPSAPS